jgi:hypothetical protein
VDTTPIDRQEPLPDVVEHQLQILIHRGKSLGPLRDDAFQPDHVVEEAPGHEARGDGLEHDESGVDGNRPDGRFVVEHAGRKDEVEQPVVSRHGDRRQDDDHRVGEHRKQREQNEEIEVHLDLHGPLTEVHEQSAHAHGREPERRRDRARVLEVPVRQRRSDEHQHRQARGKRDARLADRRHPHEHGHVQIEEDQGNPVHPREVPTLERTDFFR